MNKQKKRTHKCTHAYSTSEDYLCGIGPLVFGRCMGQSVAVLDSSCESPGMTRLRFKGSDQEVLACLQKHIRNPRSLWYPCGKGAKRSHRMLIQHLAFIQDMYALQPNLSFKSSQLRGCMQAFCSTTNWFASEAEKQKFIDTIDLRIRKMCRDCCEGLRKNRLAPWVVQLFGEEEQGKASQDKLTSDKGADDAQPAICESEAANEGDNMFDEILKVMSDDEEGKVEEGKVDKGAKINDGDTGEKVDDAGVGTPGSDKIQDGIVVDLCAVSPHEVSPYCSKGVGPSSDRDQSVLKSVRLISGFC